MKVTYSNIWTDKNVETQKHELQSLLSLPSLQLLHSLQSPRSLQTLQWSVDEHKMTMYKTPVSESIGESLDTHYHRAPQSLQSPQLLQSLHNHHNLLHSLHAPANYNHCSLQLHCRGFEASPYTYSVLPVLDHFVIKRRCITGI